MGHRDARSNGVINVSSRSYPLDAFESITSSVEETPFKFNFHIYMSFHVGSSLQLPSRPCPRACAPSPSVCSHKASCKPVLSFARRHLRRLSSLPPAGERTLSLSSFSTEMPPAPSTEAHSSQDTNDPWDMGLTFFVLTRNNQYYVPLRNVDICVLRAKRFKISSSAVRFIIRHVPSLLHEHTHTHSHAFALLRRPRSTALAAQTSRASELPFAKSR